MLRNLSCLTGLGVIRGINVIRRIKEAIPEVSMPWLLSGEGDMLVETGSISPLREAYEFLRSMGIVRTQTDVAVKTGYNKSAVSHALHGTEGYVTNSLCRRLQ